MARTKGATSDKLIADALRLAVNRQTKDAKGGRAKRINVLADKMVELACNGDVQAAKMIRDSLDGRPAQQVDLYTPEGMDIRWKS